MEKFIKIVAIIVMIIMIIVCGVLYVKMQPDATSVVPEANAPIKKIFIGTKKHYLTPHKMPCNHNNGKNRLISWESCAESFPNIEH